MRTYSPPAPATSGPMVFRRVEPVSVPVTAAEITAMMMTTPITPEIDLSFTSS